MFHSIIHTAYPQSGRGALEPIPADIGRRQGHLDGSPVHPGQYIYVCVYIYIYVLYVRPEELLQLLNKPR